MSDEIVIEDVISDLKRVQEFDAKSLVQRDRLGAELSFDDIVEPAERIISVFRKLPSEAILEFPFKQKGDIQAWAKSAYALFQEVLDFNLNEPEVHQRRDNLIAKVAKAHQGYFNNLFPLISYAVARTVDFDEVASEGRAAVQAIRDETASLTEEIRQQKADADNILEDVRNTAAERGVSDEAFHFQQAAEKHKELGDETQKTVVKWAWAVGIFAVISLFFHKVPLISPETNIESFQLIVSKVLIFAVLGVMLGLNIKRLLSHRHNEIVNRHRQNSLMTYRSLVSAGGTPESRDIILQQAASAIYQQQDTGYVKPGSGAKTSITEYLPRTSVPVSTSGS